ncbi:sensor histidine kinase [Solilutibacter silvestris]|uniref:histidine kinase n=1 Tax=Solilutibacter silvestris TaxID=1645665 RepID=A0A2K1Q0Y9_9GAMM|nr:sensor histidine kinase [Lysobacter silvestris]PNS08701.1 Two-component sensor kinase N-terminal [Lysobacter silvestris]
MRARSLYAQLMLWLLAPLAVIVALDLWATYASVKDTARLIQERTLLSSARTIAEQVGYEDDELVAPIPPAALEMLDAGYGDHVWYRVALDDGETIAGSSDLPLPARAITAEQSRNYNVVMSNEQTYAVAFAQPLLGAGPPRTVMVVVAQTLHERDALIARLWPHAIRNQVLMLLLGALLIWIGLQRGIAPIKALGKAIHDHDHSALDPVEPGDIPAELHPLITTLNEYIARLRLHLEAHSRFISDASHQLRTPLAVMNTQVSYGLRAANPAAKDETLAALRDSLRSNIRLVNQLLSYTEAEGSTRLLSDTPCDLAQIARHVVEDLALLAQSKEIDFGLESNGQPHLTGIAEHAAQVLIANLVDNALRYTQVGGRVTVSLGQDDNYQWLDVDDNGPGIPPEQRERVFERFVRLDDKEIDGCGLGLAIVREIAGACGARIALSEGANARGLRVRVRFDRFA